MPPADADLWENTLMLCSGLTGERSGPPPRFAVGDRSSAYGPIYAMYHIAMPMVDFMKPKPASPWGGGLGRGPRLAPGIFGTRG